MSNQPWDIPTDRQLVDQVLGGDTNAFGSIIKNTEGLVAQIVFKLIPNQEDRKDIAQDIYLKTFRHLGRFKFQSKLSTWIGQIAYNTCISWLQKKKLVLPASPDADEDWPAETQGGLKRHSTMAGHETAGHGTDGRLIEKELSGILRVEINRLPSLYHTLMSLYHQENLSYAEMARITGLPEGTVKSYLFRARKMLKENLLSKYKKEAL